MQSYLGAATSAGHCLLLCDQAESMGMVIHCTDGRPFPSASRQGACGAVQTQSGFRAAEVFVYAAVACIQIPLDMDDLAQVSHMLSTGVQ